jgi:putative endonuclease
VRSEANALSLSKGKLRTFATFMSEWFIYIVRCVDDSYYTGISNNVEQRIKKHNAGIGAAYTRSHRPVVLIWQESAESESAAKRREAQIKKWTRSKKENLVNGVWGKLEARK